MKHLKLNILLLLLLVCVTGFSHHDLTGLYKDDHPQYVRKDGTRPLQDDWDAGDFTITALGLDVTDITFSGQLTSTVVTGTAPFVVASTTPVSNLNVDSVDGFDASGTATASTLLALDADLDFDLGLGDLSGTDAVFTGVVQAEQLTSTDDLTVTDTASIDGTMTLATGSITDSSGTISFGDDNLTTTGYVGIGTAASSTYRINAVNTWSGGTSNTVGRNNLLWTPTSAISGYITSYAQNNGARWQSGAQSGWNPGSGTYATLIALSNRADTYYASQDLCYLYGLHNQALNQCYSGNIFRMAGVYSLAASLGNPTNNGNVTDMFGGRFEIGGSKTTGIVTRAACLSAGMSQSYTTGLITNLYGLEVDDMVMGTASNVGVKIATITGTNDYSIYTGTSPTYLGGALTAVGSFECTGTEFLIGYDTLIGSELNATLKASGPQDKLHAYGATGATYLRVHDGRSTTGDLAGIKFSTLISTETGGAKSMIVHQETGGWGVGNLLFCLDTVSDATEVTTADVKMTLLNNGDVGIGKTPTVKLDVSGAALISSTLGVTGLTTATGGIATPKGAITLGVGATAIAATKSFHVITGDGAGNTVATITGGSDGMVLRLLFVDGLVTITDTDAHTANTVDLSAAFTSADDTVLTIIFDGTSWYETARSVN